MKLETAILQLFPEAQPGRDFRVVTSAGGLEVISEWNLTAARPSGEALEALLAQPEPIGLAARLRAKFDALPTDVQAQFYGVKTAIQAALDDGKPAVARVIVAGVVVPVELSSLKAEILAEFD